MQEFIKSLDLGAKGLWFPVTVSVLFAITTLIIPKNNISWKEIYITFGVVGFVTWFSDGLLARGFDLFDIGDPQKAGLGDILSYTFIPTSLAILYLNFLTKNNKWKLTIFFTIISILIEFGMVYVGYMKYKGWNGQFQLLCFFLLLVLYYQIILDLLENSNDCLELKDFQPFSFEKG